MRLPTIKNWTLLTIDAAGIAACLAISLVAYFIALDPLIQRLLLPVRQSRELAVQRDKLVQLQKQLAGPQGELNRSGVKLLSPDQVNTRVAELTTAFGDCKLEVDDVRIGAVFPGPRFNVMPITITGRGGYKSVCTGLLHRLGEAFPDIALAKLELWGDPAKLQEPRRFRLDLLWHTAPRAVIKF